MKIVILTGAGISAESGMGTFRDEGGLWSRHRIEDVATPEGFARNPGLVQGFYNARRVAAAQAQPNAAHEALARLERDWPGEVVIVTQNVDGLHARAGSSTVMELHGSLASARCFDQGHPYPFSAMQNLARDAEELCEPPRCDLRGHDGHHPASDGVHSLHRPGSRRAPANPGRRRHRAHGGQQLLMRYAVAIGVLLAGDHTE